MNWFVVGIFTAILAVWHLTKEATAQSTFTMIDLLKTFLTLTALGPVMLPLVLWSMYSAYLNNKAKALAKINR